MAVYGVLDVPVNAGKGDAMDELRGSKPWEVGSVERMRDWLRSGTWKIAVPRGTWSHLSFRYK
jgi:hypothetical protein